MPKYVLSVTYNALEVSNRIGNLFFPIFIIFYFVISYNNHGVHYDFKSPRRNINNLNNFFFSLLVTLITLFLPFVR